MTRADALRAARALLDGMAGTTEGEWETGWKGDMQHVVFKVCEADGLAERVVADCGRYGGPKEDAAHIARSCPARLGPVLRALMEGD